MHCCPLASKAAEAIFFAATDTSASWNTIFAAFDPSSATNFFAPAARASASPPAVLPVTDTARTVSCAANAIAVSLSPVTTVNRFSGQPAARNNSASFNAVRVPAGAGLITMAFPAATAGATFWTSKLIGALNGVMPATTPYGT